MSAQKIFRTSDLARAAGVHPNTVRLYERWGLIPPVERTRSGYRIFHQSHLDCLKLARKIYSAPYPGRGFRALGNEIIQCAVADDWSAALEKARVHLSVVEAELERAEAAADLLEHWAQHLTEAADDPPLSIGEVARLLGVSVDIVRNAERNGLITVPRNSYNGYRLFRRREIERLQIIRMLTRAGYSHMAILRMFLELDAGNTRDLKKILDTPRADEDIFTAADRWLTTLQAQQKMAREVVGMVLEVIESGRIH
ncbi:MAG: MerR family transcriptional regulator [Chloroflexi bacterium]|nr:MerR family transcriptional regulator [Chloroflexota bacterium]